MRHAALALGLLLPAIACALPVDNPIAAAGAAAATDDTSADAVKPLDLPPGTPRYVVVGARAPLVVSGHDTILGDHLLTFDRWYAHIDAHPARITVDIDLSSLQSSEELVQSIVESHLLEVDKYRHATLVGTLSATPRGDRIVIDSVADIHGKKSPLRFSGDIRPEANGLRFRASFDMSRRAFDLVYAPAEPFLDDTFRVTVNALATPERVDVQQID